MGALLTIDWILHGSVVLLAGKSGRLVSFIKQWRRKNLIVAGQYWMIVSSIARQVSAMKTLDTKTVF